MRRRNRPAKLPESNIILIVVAAGALFLGWYFSQQVYRPKQPALAYATLYPKDYRKLISFDLIEQNAKPFTQANLQGYWSLIFFGFTACPDVCPSTLVTLNQAYQQIKQQQPELPLQIVFITADPERDKPQQLKSYLEYFNPTFIGLSGNADELKRVAQYFGIFTAKIDDPDDPAHYTIDHSAALILLSPKAQPYALFSAPHRAQNISTDLTLSTQHYSDSQ